MAAPVLQIHAQVYEKVFSFTDAQPQTGTDPVCALIEGNDGDFYGTTTQGGIYHGGTIFKMSPAGIVTTLVHFANITAGSNRGGVPQGVLVQGSDGYFYGTTNSGGTYGSGTIFKMSSSGGITTLVDFANTTSGDNRGGYPAAGLVQGSDGYFYGTTSQGGSYGGGAIFKMSSSGVITTLVDFASTTTGDNRGSYPLAGLIQASDGYFYGTTDSGGAYGTGTIFKMSSSGGINTLVDFVSTTTGQNRGGAPRAGLIQDSNGNFYGTTSMGGANGSGTVFKMTRDGVVSTLVDFAAAAAGDNRGASPQAPLVQGSDGNLYGTTEAGGANGLGTVFKMTTTGAITTLVDFVFSTTANNRGEYPQAGLVQGSDGNLYGTTAGLSYTEDPAFHLLGTVFKITTTGAISTLVDFTTGSSPGQQPNGLVQGSDGDFYGTTAAGGPYGLQGFGTVFRITPIGVVTTLVDFADTTIGENRGAQPLASLVQGSDGYFYGTTSGGGKYGSGTVFKTSSSGVIITLVDFANATTGDNRGGYPHAGLVQGNDGYFYGTTQQGGTQGGGTVFKMSSSGMITTLADFAGIGVTTGDNRGGFPQAALVQGTDGYFYSTTHYGGTQGNGTVFKVSSSGVITTLVDFAGFGATTGDNRGGLPSAALVQSPTLTTSSLLVNGDFEIAPFDTTGSVTGWTVGGTGRVKATNSEGASSGSSAAVFGYGGDFQGSTLSQTFPTIAGQTYTLDFDAGIFGMKTGTLQLRVQVTGSSSLLDQTVTPSYAGTYTASSVTFTHFHYSFVANSTATTLKFSDVGLGNANADPVLDSISLTGPSINFYGTTQYGGTYGQGTIFKMTFNGVLKTLADFVGGATGNNRGDGPQAALVQASDGNFYGTTSGGGTGGYGDGTVFTMTPAGLLTTLYDFQDLSDAFPVAPLIVGSDGNLYGSTAGPSGSIFRIILSGAPSVYLLAAEPTGAGSTLLQCQVNPRGAISTVSIEYGTDGINFSDSAPLTPALNGYRTTLLGTTLSGLSQGAIYYYRIRATNSFGTTVSPVATFTTLAPPTAAVTAATVVNQSSATLNGLANGRYFDATVRFEYGTDGNSFPNSVMATPGIVTGNNDTAVSATVAGLTRGTTYYYRVVATNAGGTAVSGVSQFTTLIEPTATIGAAVALSTISAQVSGSVNARGSVTQVSFEYGTDGTIFPNSVSAMPSSVSGNTDTAVIAALHSLAQGTTYYYRIRATSAGGVGVSATASFSLNILSGLTQVFPGAPAPAQGFIIVTLTPSGIQSGWRFVGEQLWRASGTVAGGLTTGDRQLEFRPVPGYIQPPTETVTVTSGAPATQVTAEYFPTTAGQAGSLEVVLKPDSIASTSVPAANRGQWRFLGEDDTQWRNSAVTVSGLLPGKYLVECKPIPGRNTPLPNVVPVQSNQTALPTITYYLADATVGTQPSVLPFQTVSTTQTLPYAYVGQIRSDVGSATGFVVNRRVVATAGHVVFDDGSLSYVTGLQWLLERDAGTYDPVPQIPQGFYVFDGYATQRTAEGTPGQSSVVSQNLDVAALYFLADAGRGGYAGYLASDSTDNEFLTSSKLKMVVGYPVNGIPSVNQGRMFATPPANVTFMRVPGTDSNNNPYRVYTTQDITSAGGNSGGPICVLYDNGSYYPAAIYLGGSAQTSVRSIDSKVVDLFGRAEVSADGGGNQVGGGIIQVNTPISGAVFSTSGLKVTLTPNTAITNGASWSLSPTDVPFPSGFERDNLNPVGTYTLYFSPATGFLTPPPVSISLTAGQVANITRIYFGVTTQPQNQIAPAGSSVSFSVTTSGTPFGYQWRRNGVNISGATGATYTINPVTTNDTATYSVVVTWQETDVNQNPIGFVSQTSSAATLTVTDTFNSWSSRFFTPTELTNTQISGAAADPDGDGVPNLLEFAFNLQPRIADRSVIVAGAGTSGLSLIRLETINNQKFLTIEFVRRRAAGSPGITYHAEFSSDLTNPSGWLETGTATVTQIDDTWERVKVVDSLVNQTKRLARVRVTMP